MLYCLLFLLTAVEGLATMPDFLRPNIVRLFNVTDVEVNVNVSNTSLSDLENNKIFHTLQLLNRERKKQERLIEIQTQILQSLHLNRQPLNVSSSIFSDEEQLHYSKLVDRLNSRTDTPPSDGLILMRSFYASCAIPFNIDATAWEEGSGLRLYYDIPFHSYPPDMSVKTALLRLYRKPSNPHRTVDVHVYLYLKPLKYNRKERKRLVTSKRVRLDEGKGWIEFDVISALNHWFQFTNRNFGLTVEVEDDQKNLLNPNTLFDVINCSSSEIPPNHPFPNLVSLNGERVVNNFTYPTLDLRTAERVLTVAQRARRSLNNTSSCTGELEYISFAEVGLDEYIVWPTGVVWTFCEGSCVSHDTPNNRESFFAHWIQRLFRVKKKNLESNCLVTRRESLPALLYDGENQVFETLLEDFVPVSCGCRPS